MRILHPLLLRLGHVMADFYHRLWQTKFIRPDNPCNKCTLRIRQTLIRHLAELVDASAQYVQFNNVRSPSQYFAQTGSSVLEQMKSQIKSVKFNIQLFNHLQMSSL